MVQVGWIGLGNMGAGMVPNLAKKYPLETPLLIFNRKLAKAHDLAATLASENTTVSVAKTVADLVQRSDIVFTCLANDAAITDTINAAVASGDIAGKLFVDSSTVAPGCTDSLSELLVAKGARFVAAPVFGVPAVAVAGQLTYVLAAKNEAWIDEVIPFTTGVMGKTYIELRGKPPGTASLMKLSGNHFVLSMVLTLSESMTLASKSGLGEEAIVQFVEAVFGGPYPGYAKRMLSGDYATSQPKFSVDNALKDAHHIEDVAEANGMKLATMQEVIRLLGIVKQTVGAEGDMPGMYGALRTELGLPYKKDGPDPTTAASITNITIDSTTLTQFTPPIEMPPSKGYPYLLRGTRDSPSASSLLHSVTLLRLRDAITTLSHRDRKHTLSWILYTVSIITHLAHLFASIRDSPPLFRSPAAKSLFTTLTMAPWLPRRRRSTTNARRRFRKFKREAASTIAAGFNDLVDRMAIALYPESRFSKLEFNRPLPMEEPGFPDDANFDDAYPLPDEDYENADPNFESHQRIPSKCFPNNKNLHRYFNSLPSNKDPSFPTSIYNIRQEIDPYPPSTAKPLTTARLDDLTPTGRNHDVCLVVKAVLPPKLLDALHVLIEDDAGEWQILHIFDFPYTQHVEDRIAAGQLLILKEPYCYVAYDGVPAIRVDHATDILYVMQDHPLVPAHWQRNDVHGVGVLPRLLKWDGEVRMKWKKYHQAIDCLTLGLKLAEELEPIEQQPSREITALYKRQIRALLVGAHFNAGYYDLALAAADAQLAAAAKFDEKAAWFKANCLLKLRQYDEAKQLILTIMQGRHRYKFKECSRLLLQIRSNTAQVTGQYNMRGLLEKCGGSAANASRPAEAFSATADYVTGIRVKKSPVHGYGIFVTRDVKAGELVFAAKAFATVSGVENTALDVRDCHGNFAKRKYGQKLVAKIVEKMYCEPRSSPLICKIYSDRIFTGTLRDEQGMVLVDSFYIDDIVEQNAVQHESLPDPVPELCAIVDPTLFPGPPGTPAEPAPFTPHTADGFRDPELRTHASFWIPASFVNHSCVPNARRIIIGDMLFVTAATDISRGDEVFLNYLGDTSYAPRNDRRQHVFENLGFTCSCPRCAFEVEHKAYFRGRQKAADTIRELVAGRITPHLPSQLAGVRSCLTALRGEQLDSPSYDLPRFDLAYALMAEEFLRRQVEGDDSLQSLGITTISAGELQAYANMRLALNMIRALGGEYEVTVDDVKILRVGFVCGWLLEAYMLAAVAAARFYGGAFWSLRSTAGCVYRVLRGEEGTFESVLWRRVVDAVGQLNEGDMLAMEGMFAMLREWGMERSELA
ncbi:hypothetical protein Dda_6681 [Drechslerella dactyloides]|uniref:SET domain-containing protein n=1 Tax=Drechslerella dactyloides TaxID=74499 RepID=A0AAD6ITZ0_DREDA|nr:hypothetical protein Dda_6681 [Drechslerella dactyloides]